MTSNYILFFFFILLNQLRSTLFPYTTLFRSSFLFRGDDVKKMVGVLSGGERARVCLAGLLLSKCQVVLLDEPTNHLDLDRKSTRLNSSHTVISYAVFCLKKKNIN